MRWTASVLLLAFAAAPCGAWDRFEVFGAYAGTGFLGMRVADYGRYHGRYGVGVGTRLMDARLETWDLPRKSRPDASAHALIIPAPLEARIALKSWEGPVYIEGTGAESSIGRVELHGWYCPWAFFGLMSEVQTDVLGERARAQINDIVGAEAWDVGLRYDRGNLWYVSAGRFEFRSKEQGGFRSRRDGRWYGAASLYFGRTHGGTYGGSPLNLLRDAGFKLCRLFGGCGIIED